MKRIHILAIEAGNEPHALRSACEHWGAQITVTWAGNSAEIIDYFSEVPADDLLIISGHGEQDALLLPQLHESIADNYPFRDRITSSELCSFVKMGGGCVLSLCCESGTKRMAHAFLTGGASLYIGPSGSPDGNVALMYALELLYACLVEKKSIDQGHQEASKHDDDRASFVIYKGIEPDNRECLLRHK